MTLMQTRSKLASARCHNSGAQARGAHNLTGAELKELMRRVADDRDRAAFSILFDHFAPRLKSFMLRAGASPETAEEVAQEAMVIVWRKASSYDPDKAAASTWIFTIARNKRIDMLRRENRPGLEAEDYPAAQPAPDPDDVVQGTEQSDVIRLAMTKLPEEQRQVVQMAFFEDKSHSAISEALNVPLGTVKSRVRLALSRLREDVSELEL